MIQFFPCHSCGGGGLADGATAFGIVTEARHARLRTEIPYEISRQSQKTPGPIFDEIGFDDDAIKGEDNRCYWDLHIRTVKKARSQGAGQPKETNISDIRLQQHARTCAPGLLTARHVHHQRFPFPSAPSSASFLPALRISRGRTPYKS